MATVAGGGLAATNVGPPSIFRRQETGDRRPRRRSIGRTYGDPVLTVYGVTVLTFMMLMYAFERRDRKFVLAFALGCALSSSYGFLVALGRSV